MAKKVDPQKARQQAFLQYQARRTSDAFESTNPNPRGAAWKSFVGERGQRLKAVLQNFQLLTNPRYSPSEESSRLFVRDVMQRLGLQLPDLPTLRLCEWLTSFQGGRPLGWREVPPGLAQAAANDGRAALVVGVGPEVGNLAAVVYPDDAGNATNPTIAMVTPTFALDPGTVLQGFRGQPSRFFANGQ